MEQALTCPECGPSHRLIKVEGEGGPSLRCPNVSRCSYRRDIPIDQRYRAAGLPGLFDRMPA